MNLKSTIIISTLALLFIGALTYFLMGIGYRNQEASIRVAIEAKVKDNKSNYTKMFEVLVQEAGVAEQYAEDFKEIYPSMIAGRYNNGQGQMMQWIQEHNPQFDTKLYQTVMVSIEAQRESFHTTQRQLIDLSRQHNALLKIFPGSFFLSDVQPIEIPVIINDAAEKAFETGKEQMPELFPRKKRKDTLQ